MSLPKDSQFEFWLLIDQNRVILSV